VEPPIVVTNLDDAGAGSLRQAIIDAPAGATIQFDAAIAGGTIVLVTRDLTINRLVTIEGPAAGGITISGGLISRVFFVGSTGNLIARNLSIVNGRDKFGGGIAVEGAATLDHSLLANNEAEFGDGGGIYVSDDGSVSLVNSTVSGNITPEAGGGVYSVGAIDSAALERNAYVGRAELVRARALVALGSTSEARSAADRAVTALANG
jgi:hypothetical protein